jgi:hypothetical protein
VAVSLSEITNMAVDSERGSGQPSVVIDNSRAIDNVLQAANIKSQNDWRKYQQFLQNQQGFYKNIGDLAKVEVATEDRDAITSSYKDILQQALEHPEIFHGRNQKLFGELQARSGQLMQQATESKLNRIYDMSNREYLAKNPDLNTEENQQLVNEYLKKPLGQRQNYLLSLPGLFDPNEIAKTINQQIEQPYATTSVVGGMEEKDGQQVFSPGEKYIYEEQGKRYDPEKFKVLASQMYNLQDKRGNQLRSEVTNRFQKLDPEIQQQYGGDPQKWYMNLMESRVSSQAVSKKNLQANPNAYKAEEIKQRWATIGIARDKMEREKADDVLGADAVLNEALSIIDKGEGNVRTVEGYGPKGEAKDLFVIDEPTLLDSFAHIDKDGKKTNIPDEVQYDKETGQLFLTYLEKNPVTGQPKYSASGKRMVKERKGLDERTWLKMIAKRSFPNKDIGTVNSIVEKVLQSSGNNLYKLNQAQKKPVDTGKSVQDYDVPTQTKIKQWMKANKVTDEAEAVNYLKSKKLID